MAATISHEQGGVNDGYGRLIATLEWRNGPVYRTIDKDTDTGHDIQRRIDELRHLLAAYRAGLIKEK